MRGVFDSHVDFKLTERMIVGNVSGQGFWFVGMFRLSTPIVKLLFSFKIVEAKNDY